MKTVDIIIPVYQGYEETLACIDSALLSREHNNTLMNIIVINDCGPDSKLTEELELRAKTQDFKLYHNETNRGFVYTVNRGMAMTQNDVVLLNSDAEVTGHWLDKMVKHASGVFHDKPVASVTPFSNNATICSYPVFCAQNPLPANESLARMDEYSEMANRDMSIELPTAVGFCMYITRKALNELGLFDEKAFGRGYGEENDFCARAIKAGYLNLFALDTFSMHEGGVSFAETQTALQQNASKVLIEKHPEYNAWVADHVFHNPAHVYRTRIYLVRYSQSDLPLVLCVLHAHGGGTEKHVEDLSIAVAGKVNILALKTDEYGQLKIFSPSQGEGFALVFKREQKAQLMKLFTLLNISRIHYHHLLGVDPEILELPEKLNIPYDFTAHDYYMMNPDVHISGNRTEVDSTQVARMTPFLESAERIFVPSVDTCDRLSQAFPDVTFRPVSHPDCIIETGKQLPQIEIEQTVRVLLIGGLGIEKGADVLTEAVAYAKAHDLPVEFHLLGYTYHSLSTTSNLMVYGKFEQKDLRSLIEKVNPHWIWFPAQTPETYSYTLSSALATGRPVLASNLGALPERLSVYPQSKVLSWDSDISEWLDAMQTYQFDEVDTKSKLADDFSVSSYTSVIKRIPMPFDASILDFSQFAENANRYKFEWSLHGIKVAVLKSLVWLKHRPSVAKLARRLPTGLQLRVKNWLLGAK